MPITWNPATEVKPSQKRLAGVENYSTIQGLLDLGLIDKPEIKEALVRTYGNQDLTGFTRAIGNFVGVSAEKKEWFEETRLHNALTATVKTGSTDSSIGNTETVVFELTESTIRLYDVVQVGSTICYVLAASDTEISVTPYTTWNTAYGNVGNDPAEVTIVGNDYKYGTEAPTEWIESSIKHRESPFVIIKDKYEISGSQMTNIAWVHVPAGKQNAGGWVWYLKGENDQRARFENYAETMMIQAEIATNATVTATGVTGTEGLFSAINDRGITGSAIVGDFVDMQNLAQELEKERGAAEYTAWCTIGQTQSLDDMLAVTTGSLANTSYGLFNNDKDMAVNLGFSGFRVSGYDFYYKKWKLANDPEMLGAHTSFNAVFIPSDTIMDARSGEHIPSFSIGYKEAEGYSREIVVFLQGSANVPVATNTKDTREIHYLTERNMCVAGANRYAMV